MSTAIHNSVIAPPPATRQRVNILYVIDQLCAVGGAEKMLWEIIRELPREKFSCRLLTFKHDSTIPHFQNPPCPLHVFPLRRTYDLNAWHVARRMVRIIRDHDIHVVHTFHETSDLWAGLIAKFCTHCVVISSRRDMGFHREKKHELV